jgi:hypothetical protein
VDRIIRHLELTFVAEKPSPAHVFEQVALMAAEESGDYEYRVMPRGEGPSLVWPLSRPPGPTIRRRRLPPVGICVIDSSPGLGYPYFMRGRVDSEPEAGGSMPLNKSKFLSISPVGPHLPSFSCIYRS